MKNLRCLGDEGEDMGRFEKRDFSLWGQIEPFFGWRAWDLEFC
jgi:hypothetical protein